MCVRSAVETPPPPPPRAPLRLITFVARTDLPSSHPRVVRVAAGDRTPSSCPQNETQMWAVLSLKWPVCQGAQAVLACGAVASLVDPFVCMPPSPCLLFAQDGCMQHVPPPPKQLALKTTRTDSRSVRKCGLIYQQSFRCFLILKNLKPPYARGGGTSFADGHC